MAIAVFAFFLAMEAPAQVARVFLSGTGDDLNDCSNAATPCRSLQAAVNQSSVNGQVIVMTSGGFGTANITKSLTINAPAGIVAFDARTINVTIGATDKVVIRGLSMNGAVFGDSVGINFNSGGTLVVEDSVIAGFLIGIQQNVTGSNLVVKNCEFRKNGTGISATTFTGPQPALTIEHCRFASNMYQGVFLYDVHAVVRDSVAFGNGIGFRLQGSVIGTSMLLDGCIISHNTTGISSEGYTAQVPTVVRVTNSTIFGNTYGVSTFQTGEIVSYGTNHLWRSQYQPFDGGTFTSTVSRQ
jgi:hypothetical protein